LLEKLGNGYGDDAEVNYAEWAEKSVKEIMAAVNAERRATRQAVEEDLAHSLQEDGGNGNRGNGNTGKGSNGNRPGNASNGNPGRGNNR
jgi:membrane protein involved in colicin uptake